MQTPVHCAPVVVRLTEILPSRAFLIFGDMHRMVRQLRNPLVFCRGNRYNRNTEQLLQLIDTDCAPVFPHLVHHIQCKHHRNIQLQKLHCQIQIALNVGRVHNIDNSLWVLIKHKIPCDNLLT